MPIPDSLPWMEGVDAKLRRARHHLEQFGRDSTAFLSGVPHNFASKTNDTESWIVYWCGDAYPPIDLSAVIGDCLFNMRSALDNLVCGLVRTRHRTHACVGRSFPIHTDGGAYAKARKQLLRGVPENAKKVIDRLQPFQRPMGSEELDPLNLLNVLCNRDKHRAILITTAYSKDATLVVHATDGSVHRVMSRELLRSDGPSIIPVPLPPRLMHPSVRIEARGRAVIAFRDTRGPWGDRTVGQVLLTCLTHLEERVIPRFRPFFVVENV